MLVTEFKALFFHGADTDEDMNFRRPKRHRASFRPPSGPRTPRSDDDGDGATPSSPGRSQHGMYSSGDVPRLIRSLCCWSYCCGSQGSSNTRMDT